MRVFTKRFSVAAGAALLFLVFAAGTTSGSPGDPLILGDIGNDAANTNTGLVAQTGGSALRVTQNGGGNALHGIAAANGLGVAGVARGQDGYGMFALNSAATDGAGGAMLVRGRANDGVVASTDSTTLLSTAVKGTTTGFGYGGWFSGGATGFGLYGESDRDLGSAVDAISRGVDALGLYGLSEGAYGAAVYGITTQSDTGYAGFFAGPTYVLGDLTITGTCTGCTTLVYALNGGAVPLERGTALTIVEVQAPVVGSTPLLVVAPAGPGEFVIGIMDRAVEVDVRAAPASDRALSTDAVRLRTVDRDAEVGGHLGMVMNGVTYAWVEAGTAPIAAGDPLTVAAEAGLLGSGRGVDATNAGAIVGFALEPLESGRALIAVFVSPR